MNIVKLKLFLFKKINESSISFHREFLGQLFVFGVILKFSLEKPMTKVTSERSKISAFAAYKIKPTGLIHLTSQDVQTHGVTY